MRFVELAHVERRPARRRGGIDRVTKRDIETRGDLEKLLNEFYAVIIPDEFIGHHFVDLDLETHLPIIVDFWEKVLFGKPVYFNNPLAVHQKLHEKSPLEPEHFSRWIEVFCAKVDEYFKGPIAEDAKLKAKTIGRSLNQWLNGGVGIQRGA